MRPVKHACSDTVEESISSTDEVAPHPTAAPLTAQSFTNAAPFLGLFNNLRLEAHKTNASSGLIRPVPVPALLNTREFGGYAGTRVGEAQNPGPATHARDWTVTEQPNAAHRRVNEAGDSVPSRIP